MTHKVDYKKIRTDIINGKKRCIYMKPKGKREYVKSGGEFVSLSAYIKTLQKKNKKKGGGDGEGYVEGYYGPYNSPQSSPRIHTQELPNGWEMRTTADNKTYYYNIHTGAATMTNPLTLPANVSDGRTQTQNTRQL
jgi:hypothetical protein